MHTHVYEPDIRQLITTLTLQSDTNGAFENLRMPRSQIFGHPHMLTENPTELLTEELTDDRPKI
jgi:hypothetical protein